ncbi:methyltransferase domain-containing protein [Planctobacterium marinum]|uniref:Methyltransferase n=1 Tax=Planctobacterium marinum TaxID=1631968 RepID=A0AA48HR77_9ALTE|nr:methyltransferase [Planctobacterium marinum]
MGNAKPHVLKLLLAIMLSPLFLLQAHASKSELYQSAIEHPERLASDLQYDEARKPLETLLFTQINEGDKVVELGAGGGYTTELLSWVVGTTGKVYAHFLYNQQRLAEERLANVVSLKQHHLSQHGKMLEELKVADGQLDGIVIFYILHDIYLNEEMNDDLFPTLLKALKPGGKLIILDNAAAIGSGLANIGDLHRIDENYVKQVVMVEGFELDAELQSLRNLADDHTKPWGDFKGQQDRFGLRFVKP